jgi:hypothetical protein
MHRKYAYPQGQLTKATTEREEKCLEAALELLVQVVRLQNICGARSALAEEGE